MESERTKMPQALEVTAFQRPEELNFDPRLGGVCSYPLSYEDLYEKHLLISKSSKL